MNESRHGSTRGSYSVWQVTETRFAYKALSRPGMGAQINACQRGAISVV
jgi:hypothetical protein